jgi:imidazolonepropionase
MPESFSMATDSESCRLYRNARLATMRADLPGLGVIEAGAVGIQRGQIVFAGPEARLPANWGTPSEVIDCEGRWITPGLIDCHTHLVYASNRAHEFEQRLAGATYEQIALAGGGILSSVKATRAAGEDELTRQTLPRLDALLAEGVTTVEIKSGYGLDRDTEMRQLLVARRLGRERPVDIVTTYLGPHALPPEAAGDRAAFIDRITQEILPAIAAAGLADAVDGFCEGIAFTPQEIAAVFDAAVRLGLPVKLHADQLSNLGGAALAAHYGALSADHLEHTDEAGVAALAGAGTVAVLLPGAFYFMRDTCMPPIELFRTHGVAMAVATDSNPGTSPLTSLLTALNMAATLFRMTVDECLVGVTRAAARALGRLNEIGTLEAGKRGNLAIWNIERPAELVYRLGFNPLQARLWNGLLTQVCKQPRRDL